MRSVLIKALLTLSLMTPSLPSTANKSKILVRPPSASAIGFEAYLRSQEDKVVSLSTYQLNTWIPKPLVDKIASNIEAQLKKYSNEPGPLLVSEYYTFLRKSYEYNWPLPVRKSLAKLWLRTYELESEPLKKSQLLEGLVAFYPDFQPSPKEFLPPILAIWKQTVQSRSFFRWRPLPIFKGFRYLIVNGKAYQLNQVEQITLPESRVHLTALSDTYLPVNRILTGQELRNWQPPQKILVRGLCKYPHWHPKLSRIANLVAYFGDHCLVWQNSRSKKTVTKMNPKSNKQLLTGSNSLQLTPTPKATSKKKWGWMVFIGAVSGIIGYSLIRNQQSQKNNKTQPNHQPTSHHGF